MTYGCKIMVLLTLCRFFGPPCTTSYRNLHHKEQQTRTPNYIQQLMTNTNNTHNIHSYYLLHYLVHWYKLYQFSCWKHKTYTQQSAKSALMHTI